MNRKLALLFFSYSVLTLQHHQVFGAPTNPRSLGHELQDSMAITPEQERAVLQRQRAAAPTARTVIAPGQEHIYGKWEGPYRWPVVAIHSSLLSNGKVLSYDSVGDGATESFTDHSFTRAALWDPISNSHTFGNIGLGYNLFCSGLAKLSNGQLFIAGGNKNQALQGINRLTNYDPFSTLPFVNQFSNVGSMMGERWYPSITPLANGEMLISGGGPWTPEIRQFDGSIRSLSITENFAADRVYHWLKAAPNGKVAYLGPNSQQRYLDLSNGGTWQKIGERDGKYRDYGSFAPYGINKVMVSGGGYPAESSTVSIDLNTLKATALSNMKFPRRQHNLTALPDGSVLATGGFKGGGSLFDFGNAVYAAEVWKPTSGLWARLASMKVHRAYHSIALLLPDARVLSAGGGLCNGCLENGYHQKNAEIFSPPYLFNKYDPGQLAPRPSISSAPADINVGTHFMVDTPNAANISKVSLIRLGSVTHGVNMEQNFIPLTFIKGVSSLDVTAPADNNIATPGYYMLFIVDTAGVPSIANIIKVNGGVAVTVKAAKTYQFISQANNLCLDVPGASRNDQVQLQQKSCNGATNQAFQILPVAGKTSVYTIINQNSNKCVDVAGNSQANGAAIQQYTCNGTTAQQFLLNFKSNGIYELVAKNGSNRCINSNSGSVTGAPMQLRDCNATNAQRFKLVRFS
jgi:Domain of unknown function (DUF1929)/Ricin-type beta-trefoil lectin domain-like